jgi:hypothetical protein
MGKHGNGDNTPADGDRWPDKPGELPELPALPEGVTVPDDLSALADEADLVRAELDHERREGPGPPAESADASRTTGPALATPLLIMAVAVVISLVSLFAMAWSGTNMTERAGEHHHALPGIVLTDAAGQPTDITAVTPVVIMMVESCDCGELIAETVAAAPPGVTVVAVGDEVPAHPAGVTGGAHLRLLADPDGELRDALRLGAPHAGTAAVVLADQDRTVIHTVPAATSTAPYEEQLASLGSPARN